MVETAGIIPEIVVVDATVDGVSKFRDKMRISLTIPAFKSEYPTNCTDFPEGMDTSATVGDLYRLALRRQSLVKRQGGGTGDGSKPFHYYWGINGRSEEPPTVFAQAATPTSSSGLSGNGRNDPAGVSIERQVAYKGAVELAVAKINAGREVSMEEVLQDTEQAARTIHGGAVAMEEEVPIEDPSPQGPDPESQEAFDNLGAEVEHKIGNLGDFLTKAMQEGHGVASAVQKKLKVAKPVEILEKYKSFDAAWKELVKA